MAKGLFDCTGKVTLVTGGNGGIGLGFAMGVAKMGGDIAIWARNAEKNEAAAAALREAGAGRVETYQVDVASEEAIIDGYATLLADFGRIDCVFANSGRASRSRSVLTLDSAEWHDLLAFTLREGAKAMVARAEAGEPGGSLVYCGSLSMFHGIAGINNYAASKGGMGAAVRGMAAELGKYEIRANSIAPGYIKTGIGGDGEMSEEMKARMAAVDAHFSAKTPIHRPGAIEDFEGIGAYLASDASRYHSGDTIVIDGGSLIYPPYAF